MKQHVRGMVAVQSVPVSSLLDRRVSRYASYPTVVQFAADVVPDSYQSWISGLSGDASIGLYVHIPFCQRLCWFCSSRTQAARCGKALERYLGCLIREINDVSAALPRGVRIGRIHWGGGSPTVLGPDQIERLAAAIRSTGRVGGDAEFIIDIDPRFIGHDQMDSLAAQGATSIELFVQDLDPEVQHRIGRVQPAATIERVAAGFRERGVSGLEVGLLYGLPGQGASGVLGTLSHTFGLDPDRVSLTGYAHVPWLAKRQRMIDEAALPDARQRYLQFKAGSAAMADAGYVPVGINQFVKPGHPLAVAARAGRLRRRFQCYSDDRLDAVIGIGASSVSRLPRGLVQNTDSTAGYCQDMEAGRPVTKRGWKFSLEDRIRARAIEMLMCGFRLDMTVLQKEFGDFSEILKPCFSRVQKAFSGLVDVNSNVLAIPQDGPLLARLVAECFDAYAGQGSRYTPVI